MTDKEILDLALGTITGTGAVFVPSIARCIRKWWGQGRELRSEVQYFLGLLGSTSEAPKIKHCLASAFRFPRQPESAHDVQAAGALHRALCRRLRLAKDQIHDALKRPEFHRETNVSLVGGPSANLLSQLALGFKGKKRFKLRPDLKHFPYYQGKHPLLKYYSIADVREESSKEEIAETEKTGNPYRGTFGIMEIGAKAGSGVYGNPNQQTLLLTRIPNLFAVDSREKHPWLGLITIDGEHGPATEAFKHLFSARGLVVLKQINSTIKSVTDGNSPDLFQVPILFDLKNQKEPITTIKKQPIHVVPKVDQAVRRDAYQYAKQYWSDVMRARLA